MTVEQVEAAHRWAGDKGAEFALKGDRYLPHGGVRHRTQENFYQAAIRVSSCGLSAGVDEWRGTGSQDEYERLSRIPRCLRCLQAEAST